MSVAQINLMVFGGLLGREDSMTKKYGSETKKSARKWKSSSKKSASEYARSMAKMFGTPKKTASKNYKKGIESVSEKKFARSIDKEAQRKWKKKLKEAVC